MKRLLIALVSLAGAGTLLTGCGAVSSVHALRSMPAAQESGATRSNSAPAATDTAAPDLAASAPAAAAPAAAAPATAAAAAPAAKAAVPPAPGVHAYTDTFTVQHPYDLPEAARFSVGPGPVYNAWVLKGDKPLKPGSGTGPRTEMRWATNWSKGLHVWEADVLVDAGTDRTAIMQVKSNNGGREAIYAQVVGGNLYNSASGALVARNVLGQWFHMACAYDPAPGVSRIWINGQLVATGHYPRPASTIWYFKNGVYSSGGRNLTNPKSQAHFENIQFWSA
jgi:hypothetical protein